MSQSTPLPIVPPPGVVLTESDRIAEGRWIDALNVRFVRGRPQKLGGCESVVASLTDGVPRALHAWRDNVANRYLAAGTYKKLYTYDSDFIQYDITPYRDTGTLGANPFTTTSGSATVAVVDIGHGLTAGDIIVFSGATAVGGITPNGTFTVDTVQDANNFRFSFTSNASSSATGGGASVAFSYEVQLGVELGAYGLGWGIGGWGLGTWGTARASSSIVIEPRVWSLDHFGKYLIASYNGGSIYEFDPTASQPWGRATLISADAGLPTDCRYVFVTPERFIVALRDNMQMSWCSQGDRTVWTPATGNTANIRTLTEGTKLVAGRVLSDFIFLVWSDGALYRNQYTGSTYVYNSSLVATGCGLIAPGAAVTAGGIAYWMGPDNFWMYAGSVTPMPNVEDIRKWVYDQIKVDYAYQCTAVYVPQHNAVQFYFVIEGQTNPTLGVEYSINDQSWVPLKFGRTSGTHFTQGDTRPYMGLATGDIYQHEVGHDDNGAVMPWSITLAPYAMTEGTSRMDIDTMIMDFKDQIGNINVQINTWDFLNDSAPEDTETETHAVQDSGSMDRRISGRYIGMVLSCSELGSYFRLGKPVAMVKPSGKRL